MLGLFKYKKTYYEAGGLIEEVLPRAERKAIDYPKKFVAPKRADARDMCLSSSNQYETPHCAGYSTAGYIEYQNWKKNHYPEQVDGDMIYLAAKQIDNNNNPGTTLFSAIRGAMNLRLIIGTPKFVQYPDLLEAYTTNEEKKIAIVKFALHEYGVCVAGFQITDEWNMVEKDTGMIRNLGDRAIKKGGHAVLLCGYDDSGVYIQNSWGASWGIYGFATLSWEQYCRQLMNAMVVGHP